MEFKGYVAMSLMFITGLTTLFLGVNMGDTFVKFIGSWTMLISLIGLIASALIDMSE